MGRRSAIPGLQTAARTAAHRSRGRRRRLRYSLILLGHSRQPPAPGAPARRTGQCTAPEEDGAVLQSARMRTATHASAVRSPGDGGGDSWGCSAASHLGRPPPVSPPGTHCLGPRTFSSCPTKVNLGDLGGAGSTASSAPDTIGETEVAFGGSLGETGSDGTVGQPGAESQGSGVCMCVYVCWAACWLSRSAGTPKEGRRGGSPLAGPAPRECPPSWVCSDLGGFDGRGARARSHFLGRL